MNMFLTLKVWKICPRIPQFFKPVIQNYKKVLSLRELSSTVDLSYKILGFEPSDSDPAPILILHGLLGNKNNWHGLGKTLMKVSKRCVVTIDLRNHGMSPHAKPHKYENLASDVIRLYNKLSMKKASLIGHSMGGRTAMVVALLDPSKVKSLIIVDISPISTTTALTKKFPELFAAMKSINFKGIDTVSKARAAASKPLQAVIKDEVALNAVLMNINKKRESDEIGWICNLDVLINDFHYIASFPEELKNKSYPGPALFIGGQHSEFIPPDDLTGIRNIFPQAIVQYIKNAGHNVHVDDPKTFMQMVISFLRLDLL